MGPGKSSWNVPKVLRNRNTHAPYGFYPTRHPKVGLSHLIMPFLVCVCVCSHACVRAQLSLSVTQGVSVCEVRLSSHADTCTGGPLPPRKGREVGGGMRDRVGLGVGLAGGSPLKCNGWLAEGCDFEQRAPSPSMRVARSSWRAPQLVEGTSETRGAPSRYDGPSALFQTVWRAVCRVGFKRTQLRLSCSVKKIKRCFPRSFRANLMWWFGFFRSN